MTEQAIRELSLDHYQPFAYERTNGAYGIVLFRGVQGGKLICSKAGRSTKFAIALADLTEVTPCHYN